MQHLFLLLSCPLQLFDSQGTAVNLQILPENLEGEGTSTKELFLHFQSPPVLPQPNDVVVILLSSDYILPQR